MTTEFGVAPSGANWYYCAVIERPDGETDYLDGYASGEKPTVTGLREHTACRHAWVAGMMYVHEEDLESVSDMRKVECEKCDAIYGQAVKPLFKVLKWEVRATSRKAECK